MQKISCIVHFVYNLLYLVKYAHNDSQAQVGYGNTYTYSLYYKYNGTIATPVGTGNTAYQTWDKSCWNAEKGSTIGLYNSSSKSTNGFNEVGMDYGYESTTQISITGTSASRGLSPLDFLVKEETINSNTKNILRDGYVGSDKYTSVFCLGLCNPWGNIWTWMFGGAVTLNSDGTANAYINFGDSSTYYTENNKTTFENASNGHLDNYEKLTYTLPNADGWYNYMGISQTNNDSDNPLASLIGMPDSSSAKGSQLTDYYWVGTDQSGLFGVLLGGLVSNTTYAGVLACNVGNGMAHILAHVGLRPLLIS